VSRVSPNACELDVESTSEPLIVESGDKRDTQLTVATNLSSTVARIGSEVATFRPTEGQVEIEGGNCVGVECPISLTHVRLVAPPFTMAGRNVSNVILDNTTALKGIKDKYGRIRFDCNSTNFVAAGTVDGYRSTIEYQALPGQVSAAYDPISGKLSLSASVTSADGTQSLNVTTQSTATARPPRANAGADQTVNNGIAQLNGSASSDPDGGTLTYLWTEGTQVLGSTAVASVNLPVGVHDILLTVTDATGRQDYDIVRVTVASGNPNGCPAGSVVLMGTPNNDNLQGTAGNDCIFGLGGQDTISGGGGNDVLSGGDGDDIVNGGDGNDTVLGGTGQDVLTGGNGNDSMSGDDGDDRVSGDAGNDTLAGGQGQDQLSGGDNDDNLNGGDGDDRLDGGNGNDRLDGAVNRDTCIGGAGTNVFLNCETQQ
jgi:Ca2+-binding RTX toxin-like protein